MTSNFPPEDPSKLKDFPVADLEYSYFRVHLAVNDARFFGMTGLNRWDDPRGSDGEFGTCYLAQSQVGAFLETLGGFRPLPQELVDERQMSELQLHYGGRVADVTHESVVGEYGIFGDLSADSGRKLTQQWALALWRAGFGGVQYLAHHHPGFSERAIALFGRPGVHSPDGFALDETGGDGFWQLEYPKPEPDGGPEPISDHLLSEMERRFRIQCVPSTPLTF